MSAAKMRYRTKSDNFPEWTAGRVRTTFFDDGFGYRVFELRCALEMLSSVHCVVSAQDPNYKYAAINPHPRFAKRS